MSLLIRHPNLDDAPLVFALMTRCEIAEYGESDSDLEDITHDWELLDLKQDAWLISQGETVVGYGAVIPRGVHWQYDVYTDPSDTEGVIAKALLAQCEARGQALVIEQPDKCTPKAVLYITAVNERDAKVVKDAGFSCERHHFQMRIDLTDNMPASQWPEGIAVRTILPEQDAPVVYELIQTAFDSPGRTRPSFADWKEHMMRADIFQPALWFLAVDEQSKEIIGASLAFNYSSMGWVRQLGVLPAWQKKGIGKALLQHTFHHLKEAGHDKAGLGVAADNMNALQFYRRVGMTAVRQYDQYEKVLTS